MTIEELYLQRLGGNEYDDIRTHLPTLRQYASLCPVVVEFGVRTGNSTTAFLSGGATVHSYDVNDHRFECPLDVAHRWHFHRQDTAQLERIPECDFLFIDSRHAEEHVNAELRQHLYVKRFIGFHDTIEWGSAGESGSNGINWALFPFLAKNNRTWRVDAHWNECKGLTILERIGS